MGFYDGTQMHAPYLPNALGISLLLRYKFFPHRLLGLGSVI